MSPRQSSKNSSDFDTAKKKKKFKMKRKMSDSDSGMDLIRIATKDNVSKAKGEAVQIAQEARSIRRLLSLM